MGLNETIYSVVMPVFLRETNHRPIVEQTIRNIKENTRNFELIIVDDGSTELTGFLKDEADVYIRHKTNQGIAASWNSGKNVSRGFYTIIINDDILVPPPREDGKTWAQVMSETFKTFSDCGVVAPKLGGPGVTPMYHQVADVLPNEKFYPGYCFMLRRSSFFEDFDEKFYPAQFEDTDYWIRIMKKHLRLYRAPFEIWHKEGDVLHKLDYDGMTKESYKKFFEKYQFDPIPYFYGNADPKELYGI